MSTSTYLAITALFWLLVLSGMSYELAYGNEEAQRSAREGIGIAIFFAWASTIGEVLWYWIKG